MAAASSPSASSTTASGLPANRRSVKTSRVTKRRGIGISLNRLRLEKLAGLDQLVLRLDQQHLRGAFLGGGVEHAEDRRGSERKRFGQRTGGEMPREEQRRGGVTCPAHDHR